MEKNLITLENRNHGSGKADDYYTDSAIRGRCVAYVCQVRKNYIDNDADTIIQEADSLFRYIISDNS